MAMLHNLNPDWAPMMEQCSLIANPKNIRWLIESERQNGSAIDLLESLVVAEFGPNHPYKNALVTFTGSLFTFHATEINMHLEKMKERENELR